MDNEKEYYTGWDFSEDHNPDEETPEETIRTVTDKEKHIVVMYHGYHWEAPDSELYDGVRYASCSCSHEKMNEAEGEAHARDTGGTIRHNHSTENDI